MPFYLPMVVVELDFVVVALWALLAQTKMPWLWTNLPEVLVRSTGVSWLLGGSALCRFMAVYLLLG